MAGQRRARARRRRLTIAGATVAVVVLVVAILVGVKLASGGGDHATTAASASAAPASTAVIAGVTGVPPPALDQVGAGKVDTPPSTVSGQAVLKYGAKPVVVYVGAEYCPYWPWQSLAWPGTAVRARRRVRVDPAAPAPLRNGRQHLADPPPADRNRAVGRWTVRFAQATRSSRRGARRS